MNDDRIECLPVLPDVPAHDANWADRAVRRAMAEYENSHDVTRVEHMLFAELLRHFRFEFQSDEFQMVKKYFDYIIETYKSRENVSRVMDEVTSVMEEYPEQSENIQEEVRPNMGSGSIATTGWVQASYNFYTTAVTTTSTTISSSGIFRPHAQDLSCFDVDDDDVEEDDEEKKKIELKKMNTPDRRSWLKFPMGVEYTHHFPNKKIRDNEDGHEFYLEQIRQALDLEDDVENIAKVYVDGGDVVEICSPVYRTWKEAKRDYLFMIKETKRLKLVAWSPKRGGGGGHINPAIPKKDGLMWTEYMRNLLVDTANRPYLGWIFNESSDNHTANCLWSDSNMVEMYNGYDTCDDYDQKKRLINGIDNRGYSIRIKDENHFEFRMFDMVRNEKDLKDHLKFVSAYMSYIEKQTLEGVVIKKDCPRLISRKSFWHRGEYYNVSKKKALKEFKKLLLLLNLDYKNYRRFVERNYYVRVHTYGKKHLL